MKFCTYCMTFRGNSVELLCMNGGQDKEDHQQRIMEGDYQFRMIFQYLCTECGSIYQGLKNE